MEEDDPVLVEELNPELRVRSKVGQVPCPRPAVGMGRMLHVCRTS